ncbi:hypothetical protein WBN73_20930 [Paenarthrobacter sp. CCNWLY172]|uniref:hypothetical protein n=1 Tax=unclassified Paenarthrobacter TaxID=2634190 RepID=UPI003077D665
MNESDGINEIFDDLLRQTLMFAARIGEQAARARQQHIEQARSRSEQEGREATARFEAERNAARVALAPVAEDRWWDTATPEQIGAAYQSSTAWGREDADIAKLGTVMDEQLAKRGVIVTGTEPGQLTALLQAKQWAAEKDPLMDSLHTRQMINATNSRDRERLNNQLVASWLSSPEAPATVQVQSNGPTELEQAIEWATEEDPRLYAEWSQRQGFADTVEATRSGESELIRQWQAATAKATQPAPGAQPTQAQNEHATQLQQAREWAAEHQPVYFADWEQRRNFADSVADERADDERLIRHWRTATGTPVPAAKPDFSRADDLRSAAYFKEAAATGSRLDGDAAAVRAEDLRDMIPLEMESGPTTDDAAWYAQEAAKADALAVENWDTSDRREDFARTLHGKADEATVDARILADVSQGTHPTAAVKGPAPSATKARKNNNIPRAHQISKGGR